MKLTLTIPCLQCRVVHELTVTQEALDRWRGGVLIQDAFPSLTPGERELLLTGICGTCFDIMFEKGE